MYQAKKEDVKNRFFMGGITEEQLGRYVSLKVITKKEAGAWIAEKKAEFNPNIKAEG